MSTAGKVLVVFVMLASLVWVILAAGVAQLNKNGNEALQKLADELADVETKLDEARHQIVALKDETSSTQEQIDRELTGLRARQTDLEEARSNVVETLTRLQYQLATVEDTIKAARATLEHHNKEHQAEEKAMADLRTEVQDLKSENGQHMARLKTLRDQFQKTYHTNLEILSKPQ